MKSALETLFHIFLIGNIIIVFAACLLVFPLALRLRRKFCLFYLPPPELTDERGRQINKYLNIGYRAFVANLFIMFLLRLIIRHP